MSEGTALVGPDGAPRCPWALSTPDYVTYHDEEWGRPVHGDDALNRVAAELAERDSRIADLESALAGAQAAAHHVSMDKPMHGQEEQQ